LKIPRHNSKGKRRARPALGDKKGRGNVSNEKTKKKKGHCPMKAEKRAAREHPLWGGLKGEATKGAFPQGETSFG